MELPVPKSIRKVKPNEIVVFEKEFDICKGGVKQNAIFMTDEGGMMIFHTDHFYTDGKVVFYNRKESNGE